MNTLTLHVTATPLGPFAVLVDGGVVHASGFTTCAERLARLSGVEGWPTEAAAGDHPALAAVRAYFAGDLAALDAVQVRERAATGFRGAARAALRGIPAGSTATYTELAARAGRPKAVRAAGSACATNPAALFVPCHRVLRSDGSLGGFLYGVEVKRALLAHERGRGPGTRPARTEG